MIERILGFVWYGGIRRCELPVRWKPKWRSWIVPIGGNLESLSIGTRPHCPSPTFGPKEWGSGSIPKPCIVTYPALAKSIAWISKVSVPIILTFVFTFLPIISL